MNMAAHVKTHRIMTVRRISELRVAIATVFVLKNQM
jgi:hypothetical protein